MNFKARQKPRGMWRSSVTTNEIIRNPWDVQIWELSQKKKHENKKTPRILEVCGVSQVSSTNSTAYCNRVVLLMESAPLGIFLKKKRCESWDIMGYIKLLPNWFRMSSVSSIVTLCVFFFSGVCFPTTQLRPNACMRVKLVGAHLVWPQFPLNFHHRISNTFAVPWPVSWMEKRSRSFSGKEISPSTLHMIVQQLTISRIWNPWSLKATPFWWMKQQSTPGVQNPQISRV